MKAVQTNKTKAFENYRIAHLQEYGDFIWIQLNYSAFDAKIISIVFEEKEMVNQNLNSVIARIKNIPYHILNFEDKFSKNYVNIANLEEKMGLILKQKCLSPCKSYWEYRLNTQPQNCLTCDIDSLEITKNKLIALEAAQLFDTSSVEKALPHIFKTFKFRKNGVNELQYLSQFNFMDKINGEAFVIFHMIDENNALDTKNPVFLIKNNQNFAKMLYDIKTTLCEHSFIEKYYNYLSTHLIWYENIKKAYVYIKNL